MVLAGLLSFITVSDGCEGEGGEWRVEGCEGYLGVLGPGSFFYGIFVVIILCCLSVWCGKKFCFVTVVFGFVSGCLG